MVWEAGICSHTSVKDGRTYLEILTWDTIDIYEWIEFEFYDLVWFWNNQSDDTKLMLGRWLGVSYRVGRDLCYWILSEKGTFLSRTIVQHLTAEEPRDCDVQERICDYNGYLEDALERKYFGTSLDGYDSFINDDE